MMAAKNTGSGQPSVDDFSLAVILVIGTAIGAWIAWMVFHTQLATAYTYLRRMELWWLDLLGAQGLPGAATVHAWFQKGCAASGLLERCTRDFSSMGWAEISRLTFYINLFLLVPIILVAARIFVRVQSTHPLRLFTRTFNVDSFVRAKRPLYPHLVMFDALDLIGAPLDHPVLGMSRTSRQFAFHHRLIADWIDEADGSCTPALDRAKTHKVLRGQLGELWTGTSHLSPAQTLLLAIALPRVAATDASLDDQKFKQLVEESDRMVRWCWQQFKPPAARRPAAGAGPQAAAEAPPWLRPEIDLAVARETIARHIHSAPAQAILSRHAYVHTILCSMFMEARRLGVLPPADMRWLRFYDRTLWYVLQNFGRQAAFAEGCAAHAHYLYEIKSGEPLIEPQLDKAIDALESALTAFKYRPADRDSYRKGAREIHETVSTDKSEK